MSRKPQQGEGSGHQGIPFFSPASSGPLSSYESPRGYTHSLGDMLHTETGMRGPSLSTFAKDWGAGYSGPALERPLFTAMAPHSTWKLSLFKEALSFLNIGFLCAHMSSWLYTCSPHPPNHSHWGLRPQCPSSAVHRNSCPAHVCSMAATQSLGRNVPVWTVAWPQGVARHQPHQGTAEGQRRPCE